MARWGLLLRLNQAKETPCWKTSGITTTPTTTEWKAEHMFENLNALRDAVLALFPDASMDEDSNGQIIIHTGMVCYGDEDEAVMPL